MKPTDQSASYYYRATKSAPQNDNPAMLVKYCRAAIAERERGELELYQVDSALRFRAGERLGCGVGHGRFGHPGQAVPVVHRSGVPAEPAYVLRLDIGVPEHAAKIRAQPSPCRPSDNLGHLGKAPA
jgi:hypothetical protein